MEKCLDLFWRIVGVGFSWDGLQLRVSAASGFMGLKVESSTTKFKLHVAGGSAFPRDPCLSMHTVGSKGTEHGDLLHEG